MGQFQHLALSAKKQMKPKRVYSLKFEEENQTVLNFVKKQLSKERVKNVQEMLEHPRYSQCVNNFMSQKKRSEVLNITMQRKYLVKKTNNNHFYQFMNNFFEKCDSVLEINIDCSNKSFEMNVHLFGAEQPEHFYKDSNSVKQTIPRKTQKVVFSFQKMKASQLVFCCYQSKAQEKVNGRRLWRRVSDFNFVEDARQRLFSCMSEEEIEMLKKRVKASVQQKWPVLLQERRSFFYNK